MQQECSKEKRINVKYIKRKKSVYIALCISYETHFTIFLYYERL